MRTGERAGLPLPLSLSLTHTQLEAGEKTFLSLSLSLSLSDLCLSHTKLRIHTEGEARGETDARDPVLHELLASLVAPRVILIQGFYLTKCIH